MKKFGVAFAVNEDRENWEPERIQYEMNKAALELGKLLLRDACTKIVLHWYEDTSGNRTPLSEKTENPRFRYMHTEYRFELRAEPYER